MTHLTHHILSVARRRRRNRNTESSIGAASARTVVLPKNEAGRMRCHASCLPASLVSGVIDTMHRAERSSRAAVCRAPAGRRSHQPSPDPEETTRGLLYARRSILRPAALATVYYQSASDDQNQTAQGRDNSGSGPLCSTRSRPVTHQRPTEKGPLSVCVRPATNSTNGPLGIHTQAVQRQSY
jgi:hypothetical protein